MAPDRATPTIHDVAAAAEVSPATVSRALSRPQLVAEATVQRVLLAAGKLGYSPSPQARWLHTGKSNALTLVLPDITNPFFFDLIRGAQHEAAGAGYTQVLVDTEESADQERDQLIAARNASDGAVLGGSRLPGAALGELAAKFPLVLVNRQARGVPSVVIDTLPALTEAVDLLFRLGHRRIGYLGGPESAWFEPRRWQAIRTAAVDHGMSCRRLGSQPPTRAAGEAAAAEVAVTEETAVITYNDLQALGLLHGLEELGVSVPDQVSIVGCDDIFGADLTKPALTTVSGAAEQAGELATRALVDRLRTGEAPRRVNQVVPAKLIIRNSTGPSSVARRG
ncbi:LacI family transcriptional regulator [Microlunatus elymi]|uniref:LacI family transcriptional regulator n=1 Tax=Microlunatus elymi TaxID=2596828 RepID=A0A516Q442_9ACTN|nr:LacI family DNA-binding transcriptional regulator [Microlunatus elymi]QDP98174.1 LacI family transcriptional regulator [Microlunatus elymi]